MRHEIQSIPSPKQQRRPLPSLLSLFFFYASVGSVFQSASYFKAQSVQFRCLILILKVKSFNNSANIYQILCSSSPLVGSSIFPKAPKVHEKIADFFQITFPPQSRLCKTISVTGCTYSTVVSAQLLIIRNNFLLITSALVSS